MGVAQPAPEIDHQSCNGVLKLTETCVVAIRGRNFEHFNADNFETLWDNEMLLIPVYVYVYDD